MCIETDGLSLLPLSTGRKQMHLVPDHGQVDAVNLQREKLIPAGICLTGFTDSGEQVMFPIYRRFDGQAAMFDADGFEEAAGT